jgi:hypothetical protein
MFVITAVFPYTWHSRHHPESTMTDPSHLTPQAVVQAQLDAYNRKDIDGFLDAYAPDAEQYALHGESMAKGHAQMKARYLERFQEPQLHARLLSRTVVGDTVVDHECITRNFPEGLGTIEMLCIFEVRAGKIRKASFATGDRQLLAK